MRRCLLGSLPLCLPLSGACLWMGVAGRSFLPPLSRAPLPPPTVTFSPLTVIFSPTFPTMTARAMSNFLQHAFFAEAAY